MKQFVIIGNSAAGVSAAESIRKSDKDSSIIIISDEPYPAYCRCLLSHYLAGEVDDEKIIFKPKDFYDVHNIQLVLGKRAVKVNPKKNKIILGDKSQIDYDCLLIATGSSAKFPQIRGIGKEGVFGFRTIEDVKRMLGIMGRANVACVLGGGLIGLKAARGLKKRNLETKVIVKSNQVLSQVLDEAAASLFRKRLEDNGIEVMTGLDTTEILGNGDVKAVKFDTGKVIACEIVIVGKGVKPNIDLIEDTQIKLNEGILVDEYMKTNLPNIYAAGDVCEAFDFSLGQPAVNALWPHAIEQGNLAGINMAGGNVKYEGSVGMNSVEFFNLPVISMGITRPRDMATTRVAATTRDVTAGLAPAPYEEMVRLDPKEEVYKKVVLRENRIIGMIFVGKIEHSGVILKLMKERIDISNIKDELLNDSFNYARVIELLRENELSVTDRLLIGRDSVSAKTESRTK